MSVEIPASALDRLIGQILADRYLVEERLGEGAMGAVYRARHIKVGRPFAVKVLHPRLLEDGKLVKRFEREAELAGRLRHPNVIGVVDVGQTPDGLHYMVMDFAAGPDLASLLDEAPMPAARVIHLTRQLLEGLYHAHEAGLIHRDFKPENVIVERDTHGNEVPRIVDFGIAILRDGGDDPGSPGRLTTNGLVLGTPHYMAPEQAVADALDHRTDLFALGILVYELLCGVLPFDGSGVEVARANLLLDPPPIADRVPGLVVDPLLEAFARRLMAKKASDRPATAKAARELLDLIDKDRDAAAKALGIAPAPPDSVRAPMTTQPSQPVRRTSSADGTFPPPPQSDAMSRDAPRPYASTASAEPLAPAKRRGPLIGAILAGVVVLGGAAVAILSSGGAKDSSARTPVATAPEAAPAPAPAPAPVAEPPPTEAPPPTVTPAETAPAETRAPATSPAPATTAKRPARPAPAPQTRPTETRPAETPPAEVRAAESRPAAATSPATPAAASAVTASSLAAQYKSVGEQLAVARAGASTDELRQRYRYIKLPEAMRTQESRDAAMVILKKISADLARQR